MACFHSAVSGHTHVCSLGENAKHRLEAGVGVRRGGMGVSHLITGVWQDKESDSTGDIFSVSSALFLVFQRGFWAADSGSKNSCKQTIWQFAALALQEFFSFFHSFSHHSMVMIDCVMLIEPGCGWWGGYQLSQLETPQLLNWLQGRKEDPYEKTMSLFRSWVEGWRPHVHLQI